MLEAQQATLSQSNWSANAQNGAQEEAPGARESFGHEAEDVSSDGLATYEYSEQYVVQSCVLLYRNTAAFPLLEHCKNKKWTHTIFKYLIVCPQKRRCRS